jgi:diguanylate cyclase (GGDEF)-like protein
LFVDLDHFKEINDSFGHPAGDELLRQLGARLKSSLRAVDIPVRVGGDEFAVLLPDIDVAAALEVAHRLASLIGEPFSLGPVNTQIGASTGIAMALDAADPAELMWRADVAMYRAKQAGSGCALYGEVPIEAGGIRLVGQLQAALEQAELCLHYQPLLDLSSGHIVGAEALLRWPHPELGMVPPLEFLPLAVEAGLMPHLTRFVLAQALGQVARWRAGGHNLSVSVNIWPSDLLEDGFVGTVDQLLVENSVGPEALVLEITEAAIKDFARSREVVEALTERGVMVSIDDFGAGATSLAYIGELRGIGELKLDRGFITDIGTRQRDLDIVRATIELGHAMGMRVVAEGIEDGETLDVLRSLGCDIAQGYYIGRPQPAERLDLGGVTELTSVLAPAHR